MGKGRYPDALRQTLDQLILSLWEGRESTSLWRKVIVEEVVERFKGSGRDLPDPRTIDGHLKKLLEEGKLEKTGRGLYRPTDYFYEYSRSVPSYLIEESENFLSIPLSPHIWTGIANFPSIHEMDSSENRELMYGLSVVAIGMGVLEGVRERTVLRLERDSIISKRESLWEDFGKLLSEMDCVGGVEGVWNSKMATRKMGELEQVAERIEKDGRTLLLSEWRKKYEERPLVVSAVFLSQIFKTVSFQRRGKPEPVNFQSYSFFKRVLELSRELWELERSNGRISKSDAGKGLSELGLKGEDLDRTAANLCKNYVGKILGSMENGLKMKMERVESLAGELELVSVSDKESPLHAIAEMYALLRSDYTYGPDMDMLNKQYSEAVKSRLDMELFRSKRTIKLLFEMVKTALSVRMRNLQESRETLEMAEDPIEVKRVTSGFPVPFLPSQEELGCDTIALAKKYFPPGLRPEGIRSGTENLHS